MTAFTEQWTSSDERPAGEEAGTQPVPPRLLQELAAMVQTAARREQLRVIAPATGCYLGSVPAATAEDVQLAVGRARAAQAEWVQRRLPERAQIFVRYHDLVLRRREELMDLVQLESGKARRDAIQEVLDVAINARYYARRAQAFLAPRRRRGAIPLLTVTREYRQPVGVVAIIAPWNYPLTLAISDAIPALLAGNGVVLKPARETPFSALRMVQLLREAGLPPDLFQVVTGRGSELGAPLIHAAEFLCFTGSTRTGRVVAREAGEQLIRSSLELGGKNPMLVLDDAPLGRAVDGALQGAFANGGQLCIAIERLYVQDGIYERFLQQFVARTRALRLGHSFDFGPDMGSLSTAEQFDKVKEHVADARVKGATVLAGGRARPDLGPYFYEPTILAGVTPEMRVFAEETFGPVVSVYRFAAVEEAIRAANDSDYGLNASVWTGDSRLGTAVARQIRCGSVNINDPYPAAWGSVDAPMGGMKTSGMGRRHGRHGILRYTRPQTVARQRLLPVVAAPGKNARWYGQLTLLIVKAMRYIPGLG